MSEVDVVVPEVDVVMPGVDVERVMRVLFVKEVETLLLPVLWAIPELVVLKLGNGMIPLPVIVLLVSIEELDVTEVLVIFVVSVLFVPLPRPPLMGGSVSVALRKEPVPLVSHELFVTIPPVTVVDALRGIPSPVPEMEAEILCFGTCLRGAICGAAKRALNDLVGGSLKGA